MSMKQSPFTKSPLDRSPFYKSPEQQRAESAQELEESRQKIAEAEFKKKNIELGDGQWVSKDDFKEIQEKDKEEGTNYAKVALDEGLEAMQTAMQTDWEATHIEIAGSQWMEKEAYQELQDIDLERGTNYAEIALTQGIEAVNQQLEEDEATFKTENTKLDTGEWIANKSYEELVTNDAAQGTNYAEIVKTQGVEALNAKLEEDEAEFKAANVELSSGEWITNESMAGLETIDTAHGTNYAEIARTQGIEALNKKVEQDETDFRINHVELNTGEWVAKSDYEELEKTDTELGTNYAATLMSEGIEGLNKVIDKDIISANLSWKLFKEQNVELDTGEWVTKESYAEIEASDKERGTNYATTLKKKGIQATQALIDSDYQAVMKKLDPYKKEGGYDLPAAYDKGALSKEDMKYLGINEDDQRNIRNYASDHVLLDTGEWINYTDYWGMPEVMRDAYKKFGSRVILETDRDLDDAKKSWKKNLSSNAYKLMLEAVEEGRVVTKDMLPHEHKSWWNNIVDTISGFTEDALKLFSIPFSTSAMPVSMYKVPISSSLPDIHLSAGKYANAVLVGTTTAAEILIPGLYAARNWNKMGTSEKVFVTTLDALSILPVAGAAGKGARTVSVAGRGARATAAFKAGAAELGRQIFFPVELARSIGALAKPVKMGEITLTGFNAVTYNTRQIIAATGGKIKGSLSSIETLVRPTKLPESTVTDIYHTLKIPISELTTKEAAFAAREKIIAAAAKSGNQIIIESGDSIITIKRSPLIRELGGGLAHTTPQGDKLLTGLVVEWKKGMPLREQGLFLSPEPATIFTETTAFGGKGVQPTIYITSPEFAEKAITTHKIYKGGIEAEAIYPVGTKIPSPKQKLFTRLGDTGQRVELYLGKRLTVGQIAKLKAEGLISQLKNIYQPSIKITSKTKKSKGLTQEEIETLAKILAESEPGLARNLVRVGTDPRGFVMVWRAMRQPTVFMSYSTYDAAGNVTGTRVEAYPQRSGETAAGYIARAEEYLESRSKADLDRIKASAAMAAEGYITPDQVSRQGVIPSRVSVERIGVTHKESVDLEGVGKADLDRYTSRGREAGVRAAGSARAGGVSRKAPLGDTVSGRVLPPIEEDEKKRGKPPPGSISWKQGLFWKYIPPPWDQKKPITLIHPPEGADISGRTPKETIQMIGQPGADVPKEVSIDLGIVDIYISNYGKSIEFSGGGQKTEVGKRLGGSTMGMSVTGFPRSRKTSKKKRKDLEGAGLLAATYIA